MSIPSLNPFKKEVYLMSPLKGQLVKDGKPLANTALEVMLSMPGASSGHSLIKLTKMVFSIYPPSLKKCTSGQ